MGYNIGPTIAVKGDKEYASALKGIKDSMKLVASEAAVMTAEFGKNNTSVAALKAKNDLLNKSMSEQQKAVSEAEQALKRMDEAGVKPADAAYVQMKTNLNHAKAALEATKTEIRENGEALEQAGRKTTDFSEKWSGFARGAGTLAVGALKGIGVAIGAVAIAAVAAGKAIFDLTKNAGKWADELLTTTAQTDVSANTLQEWAYAARFIDTEVDDMTRGMGKVVSAMRESVKRVRSLGFSVRVDPGEYGVKYRMGDRVRCVSRRFGVQFTAIIQGVKRTIQAQSETVSIVLGEPEITVIGEMKLAWRR